MSRILLGQGAYERFGLPPARLVNRYFEATPSTSEQVAIMPRPGYGDYSSVEAEGVIATYRQPGTLDDLTVIVTANAIYSLNSMGVIVGTTPVLNLQPRVSMTSGAAGVLYLTDGAQLLKLSVAAGETVITATPVAFPDFASCSWVAYLAGYFIFGRAGSHRVYYLLVGNTVISDFFSAEIAPDDLRGGFVLGDSLWLMGESTVEVWSPTGDATFPFQRQPGLPVDYSLASRDSVQKLNNALYFVGADCAIYEAQGVPQRISDNAIDARLQAVNFADLRSWSIEWQGHRFYGLDTGSETLVFDTSTRRWANWNSYEEDTFRLKTTCPLGDGRFLGAGDLDGTIYVFGGSTDAGSPIQRLTTGLIETPPVRCNNVVLQCSVGNAEDHTDDPLIDMRHSDDLGQTWCDWSPVSLGRLGEYSTRVFWWQRGFMSRVRLFEFRDNNPVDTVIRSAGYNETIR